MEFRVWMRKFQHILLAALSLLFIGILVGGRYDYYLELNDDVLIRDILAGVYTGYPAQHNIQMLYPLSALLSLGYQFFPVVPVYGIFQLACMFGCFWLILARCIRMRSNIVSRLFITVLGTVVVLTLFLEHLVFVQYTVVSALLSATAAFLFLTSESAGQKTETVSRFLRRNRSSVLLCALSYTLRSEMFFLMLPMICVAGVFQWSREKKIFIKENFLKYFSVFGSILLGMLLFYVINAGAYDSQEWKSFMEYFNQRTELYDFASIPAYEGNEDLYEQLGLTETERKVLLEDYNFGLEEELDAEMLERLVERAKELEIEKKDQTARIKESVKQYVYRTLHRETEDYPWNLIVIMCYLSVFVGGIWHGIVDGKKPLTSVVDIGWKLTLLGVVRTGLWLFILYRNRIPKRIAHPLYLMEILILLAFILILCTGIDAKLYGKIKATFVFPLMLGIVLLAALPEHFQLVDREYDRREQINQTDVLMREYCRSNPGNFYWLDVYSSVDYSQKLLVNADPGISNYDIMGGWACKSPLYEEKQDYFGLKSMREDLIDDDRVYLMADIIERGTDWIKDYYGTFGIEIKIELVDTINDRLGVYRLDKER